jgi:outer membrane protein OmpA-like peptidoglycan-associated protein
MRFVFFCLLLSAFSSSFAQVQNKEFTEKFFPGSQNAITSAIASISEADVIYANAQSYCRYNLEPEWYCSKASYFFSEALVLYKKAWAFNPDNADLNFKIGVCYFSKNRPDSALFFFDKAYSLRADVHDQIYYFLGASSQFTGWWVQAIEHFENYQAALRAGRVKMRSTVAAEAEVARRIEDCKRAMVMSSRAGDRVVNLGASVNTEFSDYGPVISKSGYTLLLTSRRPDYRLKPADMDSTFFVTDKANHIENIYISYKRDTSWVYAKRLGDIISVVGEHSAALHLTDDSESLLMYRSQRGGSIFLGAFKDGNWAGMAPLPAPVNSGQSEPSACYGPGKKSIYFSSSRPGGRGGKDIYVSYLSDDGTWGNPENLGPLVNSPGDEDGIFISWCGDTLFFSSNSHPGLGGFDIFWSVRTASGWSAPVNMGYPVNTAYDDIFYVSSKDGRTRFFSSDRHGGFGGMDIYAIVNESAPASPIGSRDKELAGSKEIGQQLLGTVPLSVEAADFQSGAIIDAYVSISAIDKEPVYWAEGDTRSGNAFQSKINHGQKYLVSVFNKNYHTYSDTVWAFEGIKHLRSRVFLMPLPDTGIIPALSPSVNAEKVGVNIHVFNSGGNEVLLADIEIFDAETGTLISRHPKTNLFTSYLDPGKAYSVVASVDGYVRQVSSLQAARAGQSLSVGLNMFRADASNAAALDTASNRTMSLFWGRVSDFNTGELLEAEISFYDMETGEKIGATRSGSKGLYKMVLPNGVYYRAEVGKEGYLRQSGFINAAASTAYSYVETKVVKQSDGILKNNVSDLLISRKIMDGAVVTGSVTDAQTGEPILASIYAIDPDLESEFVSYKTLADGKFALFLPRGYKLELVYSAPGYSEGRLPVFIPEGQDAFALNLKLGRRSAALYSAELPDIFFPTAQADMSLQYAPLLAGLKDFLEQKPGVNLRIIGHTDNVGSEAYNMALSEKRASSVRDYLASQGLDISRISTEGKGLSQPVSENETDGGKAANRRAELYLIDARK